MIELSLQGVTDVIYIKPGKIYAVKTIKIASVLNSESIQLFIEGRNEPFEIEKNDIKYIKINDKLLNHKRLKLTTIAKKIAEAI